MILLCLSTVLFADPPQNSVSLTIQGGDPFAAPQNIPASGGGSGITVSSFGGGTTIGGVSNSTSQLGTITGIAQNYFQINDISLTQGSMNQNETDLVLPGKAGLDLTISRSYSSSRYRSEADMNPTAGKSWGAYGGKGWSFNIGMRVYVIRSTDSNKINKVFVESSDGIEEYENGVSKQPGNFNKIELITTGVLSVFGRMDTISEVRFKTTDGKIFVFSKPFFLERYTQTNSYTCYSIEGYVLSEIRDSFGNKIQFNYESFGADLRVGGKQLGSIIGQGNVDYIINNLFNRSMYIDPPEASYKQLRVKTIIDTFGRVVTIAYGEPSNLASFGRDQMITGITYVGTNGNPLKIVYSYDSQACLTQVKAANLPEKKYTYTYFQPRYHRYDHGHQEYFWPFEWFVKEYDLDAYNPTGGRNNGMRDIEEAKGYLLNTITSPLSAIVTYTYEDCLITTHNLINLGASNHVVVQKSVNDGQTTKITNFIYPRTYDGYLTKESYRPPKQDYNAYYFTSVTVDNPSEVQDETYQFSNALVTKHTQGVNETQTWWDYDKMLQFKVVTLKNGIIQTQFEKQYGQYYNVISLVTKKGPSLTPIVQEETTFATMSKTGTTDDLINKNLVRLPQQSKVTDLQTNISRSTYTVYNNNGQPIECYQGQNTSGKLLKSMLYDGQGRIVQENVPLSNGQICSSYSTYTDGLTYTILKTSNGKSATEEFEKNTGRIIRGTDINGNTTLYSYDDFGRPVTIIFPDGSQKTVVYSADLKTTTVTQGGRTDTAVLDNLGRTVLSQSTGKEDTKVEYYFSNLPSKTYKKQNGVWVLKSSSVYDSYLRKVQTISPDFGTSTVAYDTPALNKITTTDPLGRQTIQTLDEFGQSVQTQDSAGGVTTVLYNGFGEITKTIDPRGLVHKIDTDAYGRPLTVYHTLNQNNGSNIPVRGQTNYNSNNPDEIDSMQVYDRLGTLFRTYSYVLDNENRLSQTLLNNQIQETLTYEESGHTNGKGRLTKAETPDAITQYDFDNMGRITKETTTAKTINKTWDIQYVYNTNGQLVSLRYPDGKLVEYSYDTNQRLSSIKYNNQTVLTYSYNPNGTINRLTYGNGKVINYEYQKEILLSKISDSNLQYNQTYTFDPVGKITLTQHNDYVTYGTPLTRGYTYTIKDELKTVDLNGSRYYTHDFDKNSNLIRFETRNNRSFTGTNLTQPSQNMLIDIDSDQLLEKRQKDGSKITVSYDAEGNMASKKYILPGIDGNPPVIWTNRQYLYNYQGQLQIVSENGQILAQYGYDHKHHRIYSNTVDTAFPTKFYYWDLAGRIIGEGVYGQNGADFSVRYIYNGNQKIAMERRDMNTGQVEMLYFINNAQGTPVMIVDQNNNPISRINMDEYGNPGIAFGPRSEVNFTGKKMDLKTDLYYFNQRFYDPELGRFLQEDPAGQTLNPYLYSGNNPLMYVDPNGEWFFTALFTMVGMPWLGAALDTAAWAGTAAAGLNFGIQYWSTSGNLSKMNWGAVWNSFGSAAIGSLVGGLPSNFGKIDFGSGFWNELGSRAVQTGVGNVIQGVAQGDGRIGERFLSGAQQGGADFLAARTIGGAQISFGKEYKETYDSVKAMVEKMGNAEGYIIARDIGGVEHWQVIYNSGAEGVKNFGSLGAYKGIDHIALSALGLEKAWFGPDNDIREYEDQNKVKHIQKYRIVKKLNAVNKSVSESAANQGYNLPFNNCVHIANLQN